MDRGSAVNPLSVASIFKCLQNGRFIDSPNPKFKAQSEHGYNGEVIAKGEDRLSHLLTNFSKVALERPDPLGAEYGLV